MSHCVSYLVFQPLLSNTLAKIGDGLEGEVGG